MKRIRLNRREREVYDRFVNTGGAIKEYRRGAYLNVKHEKTIRSLVYKGLLSCDFKVFEDYPHINGAMSRYYWVSVAGKHYGSAFIAMPFDFNRAGQQVPLNRVFIKTSCDLCYLELNDPIGEYYGYNG